MENLMPRYRFAVSTDDVVREAGVVQSESFGDALSTLSEHVSAHAGDTLEIGVAGFPPARFIRSADDLMDTPMWTPQGRLAA
jgi:hypothetical protein